MADNTPTTEEEFLIPEGKIIMSETDLKGYITKVNDVFCEMSGYTEDELLGKPHSIIRHPEVPGGIFADMWKTIQSGRGWSQIVKNRRKDGKFYWLRANVGPIQDDDGNITGYISHRMRCDGLEKQITEDLYKDVADGFLAIEGGIISVPD